MNCYKCGEEIIQPAGYICQPCLNEVAEEFALLDDEDQKKKDEARFTICPAKRFANDGFTDLDEVEVIPETVGEFIGLLYENGEQIFDGDVLTAEEYPFQDEGKPNYNGIVCWFDDSAQFGYELKCVNPEKNGISDGICEAFGDKDYKFSAVGNIHDSPELLDSKRRTA